MAFEFRLKALLRIRKRMEEAAEMKFASLVQRRDRARFALETETARLEEARNHMEKKMKEGMMSDEFQFRWLQISHLEEQCKKFAADLEEAEADLLLGRKELARRHVEKELVSNLQQRDLRKYLQEVDRQLQKELDDLASLRHGRSRSLQA